jgi:hypothetical protein
MRITGFWPRTSGRKNCGPLWKSGWENRFGAFYIAMEFIPVFYYKPVSIGKSVGIIFLTDFLYMFILKM